jgi:patatin-like phospholipase/acyl hydrolase
VKLVVSVDGGGIRGILPARLIQAIQEAGAWREPDLIAGTSTGGIIACGLVTGVPAETMAGLYIQHGTAVFDANFGDGVFSPKYSAGNLEKLLQQILGTAKLSDARLELLVPAYCVQLPTLQDTDGDGIPEGTASWFFKSWEARTAPEKDQPLWAVARATSAAPTYFPTALTGGNWMVDGGVFANNPADCAWAAASRLWPGEEIKVLSIGTGSKIVSFDGARTQNWGAAQWAPDISSVFMDGAADKTSYIMKTILGGNFLRCETALVGVSDAFDDASAQNIANLNALADKFIAQNLAAVTKFLA